MKRILLFIFFTFLFVDLYSQLLTVKDFLTVSSVSPKKFDNYIGKKSFVLVNKWYQNDTLVNTYRLKTKSKPGDSLLQIKFIETYQKGEDFSFAFFTSSQDEYQGIRKDIKNAGFFCGKEAEVDSIGRSTLFQKRNISINASTVLKDEDTLYSFRFYEKELPIPASIRYAEDLLQFTSHEYLVSMFGEKNVVKDLYYFSEKEISKCSVLFPHTKRQAVFIWADEMNMCRLSYVLVGGNMTTGTLLNYNNVIMENTWMSKEGIYAGMSLSSLEKLNGNDFKIYGKNSEFPLMIVPENTGKINFRKNIVVLSYLSSNGSPLLNAPTITAEEIMADNPGLFVFMIMLLPGNHVTKSN